MGIKANLKRNISIMLSLCLCLFAVMGVIPQAAKAASPEVELYYAKTVDYVNYENGTAKQYFCIDGYVAVQNLGSNKTVTLRYSQANGPWQDAAATYVTTAPDGYEVWHFRSIPAVGRVNGSPGTYSTNWNFAVKYEVNGNTYWDNNGGNNYYLSFSMGGGTPVPYVLKKSALIQDHAYKNDVSFEGQVVLKNLAYAKTVRVRYTLDNWSTYSDVDASYTNSLANNLETWSFNQAIPAGSNVKYAIYYTVNGVTYWDNNFGLNYTV